VRGRKLAVDIGVHLGVLFAVRTVCHGELARKAPASEWPTAFDVSTSLDAFYGDAVPLHLLTLEAFAACSRPLARGGILAVQGNSRFVNLRSVAARLGDHTGRRAAFVKLRDQGRAADTSSAWVLLTDSATVLDHPLMASAMTPDASTSPASLWTDRYSSLLHVLGR